MNSTKRKYLHSPMEPRNRFRKMGSRSIGSLTGGRTVSGRLCTDIVRAGMPMLVAMLLGVAPCLAHDNEEEEIHQTVARISYVSGDISFSRGDDPDNWQPADLNVPMTQGDRIYAGGNGRLELQIHGGNYVRLASGTDLTALSLTDETKQFSVNEGLVSFQIRRLGEDEIIEVDTPDAAVTFERVGEYRVSVDPDGNTRVGVVRGRATVAAGGGEVPLNAGEEMDIYGTEAPQYDVVSIPPPDRFDGWVAQRERRLERVRSQGYVSAEVAGVEDLDEYGRWSSLPGYGMVWTPTAVEPGWSPYVEGHWVWQDPWGWTWVASEPWGWAPYHYGRWVVYSSRWYWVPVPPSAPRVAYSPALVAFVGGGGGRASFSVSVGIGGAVGWFPLAPADPLVPWWGPRASVTNVNVTNVTYVNRTYITVVNQNTFVSGTLVKNNIVRDQNVIRQVRAAPVARGPLPIVPTRASLRLAVKAAQGPVPVPTTAASRPVVARIAPPPAPPRFEKKVKVIEQSHGAPVTPVVAARLAIEDRERPLARVAVRSVAEQRGEVKLNPRRKDAKAPVPLADRPARGRPLATPDRPVQTPQTAEAAPSTPPSSSQAAPRGEAQTPEEGREGRRVQPRHARERSRQPMAAQPPPAKAPEDAANPSQGSAPNRPQPNRPYSPPAVPNRPRPKEAGPNQPQPPGKGENQKQDKKKQEKNKKKRQQDNDQDGTKK